MGDEQTVTTLRQALIDPLDDLPDRLRRELVRFHVSWVALVLSVVGTPVLVWPLMVSGQFRHHVAGRILVFYGPAIWTGWLIAAIFLLIAADKRLADHRRVMQHRRIVHLAPFQWFEVWAAHRSRRFPAFRWSRTDRTFLQFFVHPDPAVPRFLTRGTDLMVTGACTAGDLRVVTAHLDLLLHAALVRGLGDPQVGAAIRPVPRNALPGPNSRRLWEVHDPVAAHALIATDLASGWPTPALVAHYRGRLSARSITP